MIDADILENIVLSCEEWVSFKQSGLKKFIDIFFTLLWELCNDSIDSYSYQMVVGLTVAITFKRLFMRLVISQSPVKYLPLSLVTKLSDCLVCMLLSDANPDLISHQFLSEKLLGYRLSLIEEVHHR